VGDGVEDVFEDGAEDGVEGGLEGGGGERFENKVGDERSEVSVSELHEAFGVNGVGVASSLLVVLIWAFFAS
jgi:hypothetical protein